MRTTAHTTEGLHNEVPLSALQPHPKNRPFRQDSPKFTSLVDSIRNKGVLTPLIARPIESAGQTVLQVLAGHRRRAAAIAAGREVAPVIVRVLDDKAAIELLVCENHEREEVTPLDDAAGIQAMLEVGWDLESIASRMGLSMGTVAKRIQLTKLVPAWLKLLEDPKQLAARAPIGIIERIARLPAETQEKLAKEAKGAREYDEAADWLGSVENFAHSIEAQELQQLGSVAWSLDDATLLPTAGACSTCTQRSSASPLLWEDEVGKKKSKGPDRCLNPQCFRDKSRRALEARVIAQRAKYPNLVLLGGYHTRSELKKVAGLEVREDYTYHNCKKSDRGAMPAICVEHPGTVKWVAPGNSQSSYVRSGKPKKLGQDGKPAPTPLKTRRAELEKRRQAFVVDHVREQLEKINSGKTDFQSVLLVPPAAPAPAHAPYLQAIILAGWFGTDRQERFCHPKFWNQVVEALHQQNDTDAIAALYRLIAGVLVSRLNHLGNNEISKYYEEAGWCAKLFGIDFAGVRTQAEESIPEPKSWANLNENGTPRKKDAGKAKEKTTTKATRGTKGKASECNGACKPEAAEQCEELGAKTCDRPTSKREKFRPDQMTALAEKAESKKAEPSRKMTKRESESATCRRCDKSAHSIECCRRINQLVCDGKPVEQDDQSGNEETQTPARKPAKKKAAGKPVFYEPTERIRLPISVGKKVTVEIKIAERKDGRWISGVDIIPMNGGNANTDQLTDTSVPVDSREAAILQGTCRAQQLCESKVEWMGLLASILEWHTKRTADWECSMCGCTNEKACIDGCSWVDENLCSQCALPEKLAAIEGQTAPAKKGRAR